MKNPIIKLFVLLLLISPALAQDELPDVAWTIGQDEPIGMFAEVFFHPDGNSFFARNINEPIIEQRSSEDGSLMNTISFKELEADYELSWCEKSESGNYILVYFLGIHGNSWVITKIIDVNTLEIVKTLENPKSHSKIYSISHDDRFLYATDTQASAPWNDYENMVFIVMDFKTFEVLHQVQAKYTGVGYSRIALAPNNEDIIVIRIHHLDESGTNYYFTMDKMKVGKWEIEKSITIDKLAKQLLFSKNSQTFILVYDNLNEIFEIESMDKITDLNVNDDNYYKQIFNIVISNDSKYCIIINQNLNYNRKMNIVDIVNKENIRQYIFPMSKYDLSLDNNKIISVMNNGFIMLNAKWTPGVVSVEEQEKTLEFNIIPNPAESNCTVELNLIDAGSLSIRLTGIDGSIVKDFSSKWYNSGNTAIQLDISDIPSGIYFVNMEMNGQSISEKLVVER